MQSGTVGTILALLLTIVAVEYFLHLPLVKEAKTILAVVRKSIRILGSKRISDYWKERALVRYARDILKSSFHLALMLVGLLVLMGVGAFLLDKLFDPTPSTMEILASPVGWAWMTAGSTIYLYARKRLFVASNTGAYSIGDRLLHRLALGSPLIGRISFEVERAMARRKRSKQSGPPVFICGLARAGTTILMRTFHSTGAFRSLTYRDMPFVLMPGVWGRLSRSFYRHKTEENRAHGDGIGVNFDSPEAFEEVFWKTFSADKYLHEQHLVPYLATDEMIHQFQQFVSQVISSADQPHQQRYLSKNNNNILRLGSIQQAFPEALIIVPFRDPIQQSISLFRQHTRFCAIHEADPFGRSYMKWLGHHEFGATHRPFRFGGQWATRTRDYWPVNINYWLVLWIGTYRYLLDAAPQGIVFSSFEELCREPEQTISKLFREAGLSQDDLPTKERIEAPKLRQNDSIEPQLRKQALEIYEELSRRT